MLAVTFIVSCLSVCGFYAYVFVQLQREHKRLNAHKKRLPEHLYETEPGPEKEAADSLEDPGFLSPETTRLPKAKAEKLLRREILIHLGLAVGGLAGLFAGIEVFNSLVTWLHWY